MNRRFAQVDVFSAQPTLGNPVAVVLDAEGLDDETMAAFARWTNLSETTFVLPPTDPDADYRLRIFTPTGELPFAGHPTLGSAHAWAQTTERPVGDTVVQECAIGLVRIRRSGPVAAFAAPPLRRSGPVDEDVVVAVAAALRLGRDEIEAAEWVANGPEWLGVLLRSGEAVRAVRPDFAALGTLEVGLVGPYSEQDPDDPVDVEVRAFAPAHGVPEDPVTGSLNAGLAVWLRSTDRVPASYVAAQGTVLGRAGRVRIDDDGTDIWVGGESTTVVAGTVDL
ncbi:PhzF family phenazine biosynthesis protein [Gordonia soli]|uniref:Putative phenazine biosynthesis protein n=1 Tax=Gordonia soli NBRC 108243 TaxID=1223545 RepID=M0QJ21_9ACTN|nr:PhzF family phenazine biosynthesis protein [Gordonia soli]GAC68630.1 putative phenazine biosynthesis protein [Gordonia soli NBRC 108243]